MKKYKLMKNDFVTLPDGTKLYRMCALRDVGTNVKKGDLGGYVQSKSNLAQNRNAWVSDCAQVSGNASVSDNARVSGNAQVFGDARVYGNAQVSDYAQVSGNTRIFGNTKVD